MTVQLARIAVDFTQDAKRSGTQAHDWLGREGHLPHPHPKDLVPEYTTDLAKAERRWPPAWHLVLIVGTSAGTWMLILFPLSIAGVLRLLP
jgi:hypothetical protein